MGVEPEDFDAHSERLEELFDDEISIRSAISRRYYYVFHSLREPNWDHDDSYFNKKGDHHEASEFLARLGHKDLADEFDDLRESRERADYDIGDDIDDMDLAIFNNNVEEFVRRASRHNFIPR